MEHGTHQNVGGTQQGHTAQEAAAGATGKGPGGGGTGSQGGQDGGANATVSSVAARNSERDATDRYNICPECLVPMPLFRPSCEDGEAYRQCPGCKTQYQVQEHKVFGKVEPGGHQQISTAYGFEKVAELTARETDRDFVHFVGAGGGGSSPSGDERIRKKNVLEIANDLTSGDRRKAYGHAYHNHATVAEVWSLQIRHKLKEPLTAREAAFMMVGLKFAREIGNPGKVKDNLVDQCGYNRVLEEIDEYLKQHPEQEAG